MREAANHGAGGILDPVWRLLDNTLAAAQNRIELFQAPALDEVRYELSHGHPSTLHRIHFEEAFSFSIAVDRTTKFVSFVIALPS